MRVDAHHHFWNPARGDYGWMSPDDPVLARIFGPGDLAPLVKSAGIEKTVLVQAAPTVAETEYLLDLAEGSDGVAGVVGWVDFENENARGDMERLGQHPMLKGFRPMIQDIPDDRWMLRDDVAWAFGAMAELGLCFDLLGFPRHLEPAATLLARHPHLKVVLDHGMKPQIGRPGFDAWAEGITRLAGRPGTCVKLSGLLTEAPEGAGEVELKPYVDHLLGVFGPDRIMWGSDWPVLNLASDYARWRAMANALTAHLGPEAQDEIFGGTATRFYGLASG